MYCSVYTIYSTIHTTSQINCFGTLKTTNYCKQGKWGGFDLLKISNLLANISNYDVNVCSTGRKRESSNRGFASTVWWNICRIHTLFNFKCRRTHTHTSKTLSLKCVLLTSQPEDVTTVNQIKLYNPVCEEAELRSGNCILSALIHHPSSDEIIWLRAENVILIQEVSVQPVYQRAVYLFSSGLTMADVCRFN